MKNPNSQVITFTSAYSGQGKATTALLFAHTLSRASKMAIKEDSHQKVLSTVVVDMDIREGKINDFLGKRTPVALSPKLNWSEDDIRKLLVWDENIGAHFLFAPGTRSRSLPEDISVNFYKNAITKLRTMFDVVIVNTSVNYLDPHLSEVSYPMSDAILFVTDLEVKSVFRMNRWLNEVTTPKPEGMGIDQSRVGIVVNNSTPVASMDRNKVMAASNNVPLLVAIPSKPELFIEMATQKRMDLLLDDPDIGSAYFRLAHKVVGQHYPLSKFVP